MSVAVDEPLSFCASTCEQQRLASPCCEALPAERGCGPNHRAAKRMQLSAVDRTVWFRPLEITQ
jgi:hypothetical protein